MKAKKPNDNLTEYRKKVEERNRKLKLLFFKPLIHSLKSEENFTFKDAKKFSIKDTNKLLIFTSSVPICRHTSIYLLQTFYDRNTKYAFKQISNLLDDWFNSNGLNQKIILLSVDVLILEGNIDAFSNKSNLFIHLKDLLQIRSSQGLATWLFIQRDTGKQEEVDRTNEILREIDSCIPFSARINYN